MLAAVELYGKQGSTLSIEFKWQRPDVAISSYPNSVTPKLIESCINKAIQEGWQSDTAGPAYKYYCDLDQHRTGFSN